MEQYLNITNRLIECVERRASTLSRAPRITDLVSQLSIRSRALSKSTLNVEIAALKKIMGEVELIDGRCAWANRYRVAPMVGGGHRGGLPPGKTEHRPQL